MKSKVLKMLDKGIYDLDEAFDKNDRQAIQSSVSFLVALCNSYVAHLAIEQYEFPEEDAHNDQVLEA